ncbi:hypothetical protein C7U55_03430 [Faecalibacillus faecis]|uniref:Uncharacterized protein n=1 Tax=Faecalibacillus faecis TaxID=1982628 RepID=A0A2T3G0Z1_9FIRM|nr:hypothetical protein C7U55_03430 [Faecalibacillus faecis]
MDILWFFKYQHEKEYFLVAILTLATMVIKKMMLKPLFLEKNQQSQTIKAIDQFIKKRLN